MQCPCSQFNLQLYKDKPYEETPCACCQLIRQSYRISKHIQLFDTDGAVDQIQSIAAQQIDQQQLVPDDIPASVIEAITKACQQNLLVTLSNTVLKLCVMSKDYPALFQVLTLKMQHPQMSYYQIGQNMVPPCSKQNVLYHLQHAVKQFPELYKAIITDTRFSGGKNAIKRVLDKVQKSKQTTKIKKLLYADSPINTAKTVAQLQDIFSKPYKVHLVTSYDDFDCNRPATILNPDLAKPSKAAKRSNVKS